MIAYCFNLYYIVVIEKNWKLVRVYKAVNFSKKLGIKLGVVGQGFGKLKGGEIHF